MIKPNTKPRPNFTTGDGELRPATPMEIFEQGTNDFEAKFQFTAVFHNTLWTIITDHDADAFLHTLSRPPAIRTSDLGMKSFVPIAPKEGLRFTAEILNCHISNQSKEDLELEFFTFAIEVFQRTRPANGEQAEERHKIGHRFISLEDFAELFETESPNSTLTNGLKKLAADAKKARLEYERKVAALPPVVDPQDRLAAGIAEGIATALAQLGIKPQPAPAK
jgi:hypothetical protein